MNVSIVGNGLIAIEHVKAIRELGHTVVMVVGHREKSVKQFAQAWNIPKYSINPIDALGDEIQCVHICTPPAYHFSMAKEAMEKRKHVVCEKPICLDVAQAQELTKLAKKTGVINAINFNVRFHDACQALQETVTHPEFGTIFMIHGSYEQEFHALPTAYSWRYNMDVSGPMRATSEIGSHWIDLARFLTGTEITAVSATYGKFRPIRELSEGIMYPVSDSTDAQTVTVETEDVVSATLRFANGALGNLLLSEITMGKSNCLKIQIVSDRKTVAWNSQCPYDIESATQFSGITTKTNPFGGGFTSTFKSFFTRVYQDIAQGTRSGTYPTFYDGYVNAAVCQAIYDSANHDSAWIKVGYIS